MIKSFINKLLGKSEPASRSPKSPYGKRVEVGQAEHGIDRSLVDDRALDVVHTLHDAGYEAYIVGGAVRDLLVGLRPKDFDVATNARAGQGFVSPRLHHRPALSHRARHLRPGPRARGH